MAESKIQIELSPRRCVVDNEVGYFHMWEHYSMPLREGSMVYGQPAGVFSKVYGIVEFKDCVRRVDPTDIAFRDDVTSALKYIDQNEDIYQCIIEGKDK